jgi:hypothetical protein
MKNNYFFKNMKLLDVLRKLGVFRSGSFSGTYKSGKDMPSEMLMDDVYDSKKDLVGKKDIEKVKSKIASKKGAKGDNNNSGGKLFLVFVILGGLMMLLFLLGTGFSFWFFGMLLVWGWFLWSIKKWMALGILVVWKTVVIGVFLLFLTFIFMGVSVNDENSQSGNSASKNGVQNGAVDSDYTYTESYAAQISGANQFTDAGPNTKTVSMWINANVIMYTPDPYEKVTIKNVELKNDLPGEVSLLIPAGGYSKKLSKDNEIEYEIIEKSGTQPKTVGKNMAYMSIQIKAINAYEFDTNKAFKMSSSGIGPSRTFQYVGLDAKDLNNTLEFDVDIEFESGEKKTVHFMGEIDGKKFLETGGVENIEMKVEEK